MELLPIENLRNRPTLVSRLEQIGQVTRAQAIPCSLLTLDLKTDLRDLHLRFSLQIHHARYLTDRIEKIVTELAKLPKVFTESFHGDLRPHP